MGSPNSDLQFEYRPETRQRQNSQCSDSGTLQSVAMNCKISPNKRMQTDVAYGHAADAGR